MRGVGGQRSEIPPGRSRLRRVALRSTRPTGTMRPTMSNPAFRFDHVHIISEDARASATWYVEMFGATIAADTVARGAPQIFVELGGMTILIRGKRPGEAPTSPRPIKPFTDFSSHDGWGTDHFGFLYRGDLAALCDE